MYLELLLECMFALERRLLALLGRAGNEVYANYGILARNPWAREPRIGWLRHRSL